MKFYLVTNKIRIVQIVGGESQTGLAANHDLLLSKAKNYRYLHISCHGWFNPTWPMASTLSLADGPFDVSDILQELRLKADLVTLSACETGRSSHILRGDELVGLVRAFLYAGTPSVLVSHWLVDDFVTHLFILLAHPYYWAPFFLVGDRLEYALNDLQPPLA